MTELQIKQFVQQTKASRVEAMKFLKAYGTVPESVRAYQASRGQLGTGAMNEYYAGGSASGTAVIAGPQATLAIPVEEVINEASSSFVGRAHSLGSASPVQSPAKVNPKKSDYTVEGQTSTRIQIELPTGQWFPISLSTQASIRDLKGYILDNYPEAEGKTMHLSVTMPLRNLDNDDETVEAAKIKRCTIKVTLDE